MQRRRSRFSEIWVGCCSSLLVFIIQLAPTLHAMAPHEHQTSSCKHSRTQIHFENSSDSGSDPCQICAHLSSSHSFLFSALPRIDEIRSVRSSAPSIQLIFDARAPELPDSRGPPLHV